MKYLLIASLTLASISSFADHHKGKDGDWKKKWDSMSFEDAKKYKTEMLSKHKTMIEEAQGCVDKTTDKKGIEACMDKMHKEMDEVHKGMKKK